MLRGVAAACAMKRRCHPAASKTGLRLYRVSHEPLLWHPTTRQLAFTPTDSSQTCRTPTSKPTDGSYRQPRRSPPASSLPGDRSRFPPFSNCLGSCLFSQATTASPGFFFLFSLPGNPKQLPGPCWDTDPTMVQQSSGSSECRTHRCMSALCCRWQTKRGTWGKLTSLDRLVNSTGNQAAAGGCLLGEMMEYKLSITCKK